MIITRTPFRISFFGGGTDYPAWYREHGGQVLSTTIDKYCYLNCRILPPFFENKHRIVYSRIEVPKKGEAILHPSVSACIEYLGIQQGVEITHNADLPARTGLGSSSSFTVGLLLALYGLQGRMLPKDQLAQEAIHVEQEVIGENVGSQDQANAAFGGLNIFRFGGPEEIRIVPIILREQQLIEFQEHLLLMYTGVSRIASKIAGEKIRNMKRKHEEYSALYQMVDEGLHLIERCDWAGLGSLLNESWMIKRCLTANISSDLIDDLYKTARSCGAFGGKLLGAGGGGFMLLVAPPDRHAAIRKALSRFLHVPFSFEYSGSQVIFYSPSHECL